MVNNTKKIHQISLSGDCNSKTTLRFCFITDRMAIIKTKTTNANKGVGEKEILSIAGER